jgi:HlyD family secretion protein
VVDRGSCAHLSLVVPITALYTGADGKTAVLKRTDAGQERVVVSLGLSGNGYIAVSPVEGSLSEADQIIVGVAPGGVHPS